MRTDGYGYQLISMINIHLWLCVRNRDKWLIFSEEEYFFEVAEAVFVGWFSFEYIIRFVAAPQKYQ